MVSPVVWEAKFNLWTLVERSEELPGQWVAHVLELDAVTHGNSLEHAIEMAYEAATLIIVDDLTEGRSLASRRAPDEYWADLYAVLQHGQHLDGQNIPEEGKRFERVAGQIEMTFQALDKRGNARLVASSVPAAWGTSSERASCPPA